MRALALASTLFACSSATTAAELDAQAPRFDATADASTFSPVDAGTDPATIPFNGGGPFLCGDCTCDGTLFYCAGVPAINQGDVTDASACAVDSGHCHRIPIECLPKASCDCIIEHATMCWCDVEPSGNGMFVGCQEPPGPI